MQEDLDAMSKELEFWRSEYQKQASALEEEERQTEAELLSAQRQLAVVEEEFAKTSMEVGATKAVVARNEERVKKLLRMVTSV